MKKFLIKCFLRLGFKTVRRWLKHRRQARGRVDRRSGMIVLHRLPKLEKAEKLQKLRPCRRPWWLVFGR